LLRNDTKADPYGRPYIVAVIPPQIFLLNKQLNNSNRNTRTAQTPPRQPLICSIWRSLRF